MSYWKRQTEHELELELKTDFERTLRRGFFIILLLWLFWSGEIGISCIITIPWAFCSLVIDDFLGHLFFIILSFILKYFSILALVNGGNWLGMT